MTSHVRILPPNRSFLIAIKIELLNLVLKHSQMCSYQKNTHMGRLNDLSTITKPGSDNAYVRTQASRLELQDWCHYARWPYCSQRASLDSEITTSFKCLTCFRGFLVINAEKATSWVSRYSFKQPLHKSPINQQMS